jgi:hypothetical protein
LRIQAVSGLIENEHRRIAQQCGSKAQTLLHAERIPAGMTVRSMTEFHEFEDLVNPFQGRIGGIRQNPEVVSPASSGVERIRLDAGAHGSGGVGKFAVCETADGSPAAGWRGKAKQDLHRCGFTCTVRAEKARNPSWLDNE